MGRMQTHRSKSTQFVERWSKAEFLNTRLLTVCLSLSVTCIALTVSLIYITTRPKQIYLIPNSWQTGSALPAMNSSRVVGAFVVSWALDWNNFNPTTFEEVKKRAERFMTPYLLSKIRSQSKKNKVEVLRDDISSTLSISQEPRIEKDGKGFIVSIKGIQIIFMGKQMVKEQNIEFKAKVIVVSPTDNDPFGLLINDIEQETGS